MEYGETIDVQNYTRINFPTADEIVSENYACTTTLPNRITKECSVVLTQIPNFLINGSHTDFSPKADESSYLCKSEKLIVKMKRKSLNVDRAGEDIDRVRKSLRTSELKQVGDDDDIKSKGESYPGDSRVLSLRRSRRSSSKKNCMTSWSSDRVSDNASSTPPDVHCSTEPSSDNIVSLDPNEKNPQLCKFYLTNSCVKRNNCKYMHSEFPCKFYYLGLRCESQPDDEYEELYPCKLSHGGPLTAKMQEVLLQHIFAAAPLKVLDQRFVEIQILLTMKDVVERMQDFNMKLISKSQTEPLKQTAEIRITTLPNSSLQEKFYFLSMKQIARLEEMEIDGVEQLLDMNLRQLNEIEINSRQIESILSMISVNGQEVDMKSNKKQSQMICGDFTSASSYSYELNDVDENPLIIDEERDDDEDEQKSLNELNSPANETIGHLEVLDKISEPDVNIKYAHRKKVSFLLPRTSQEQINQTIELPEQLLATIEDEAEAESDKNLDQCEEKTSPVKESSQDEAVFIKLNEIESNEPYHGNHKIVGQFDVDDNSSDSFVLGTTLQDNKVKPITYNMEDESISLLEISNDTTASAEDTNIQCFSEQTANSKMVVDPEDAAFKTKENNAPVSSINTRYFKTVPVQLNEKEDHNIMAYTEFDDELDENLPLSICQYMLRSNRKKGQNMPQLCSRATKKTTKKTKTIYNLKHANVNAVPKPEVDEQHQTEANKELNCSNDCFVISDRPVLTNKNQEKDNNEEEDILEKEFNQRVNGILKLTAKYEKDSKINKKGKKITPKTRNTKSKSVVKDSKLHKKQSGETKCAGSNSVIETSLECIKTPIQKPLEMIKSQESKMNIVNNKKQPQNLSSEGKNIKIKEENRLEILSAELVHMDLKTFGLEIDLTSKEEEDFSFDDECSLQPQRKKDKSRKNARPPPLLKIPKTVAKSPPKPKSNVPRLKAIQKSPINVSSSFPSSFNLQNTSPSPGRTRSNILDDGRTSSAKNQIDKQQEALQSPHRIPDIENTCKIFKSVRSPSNWEYDEYEEPIIKTDSSELSLQCAVESCEEKADKSLAGEEPVIVSPDRQKRNSKFSVLIPESCKEKADKSRQRLPKQYLGGHEQVIVSPDRQKNNKNLLNDTISSEENWNTDESDNENEPTTQNPISPPAVTSSPIENSGQSPYDVDSSSRIDISNMFPARRNSIQCGSLNLGQPEIDCPPPSRCSNYKTAHEIDAKMSFPAIKYQLNEILIPCSDVNKPNSLCKLLQSNSADPRLYKCNQQKKRHSVNDASHNMIDNISHYDPRLRLMSSTLGGGGGVARISDQAFSASSILYGYLNRSLWYQALQTNMKIQINRSVTELVRFLNHFHQISALERQVFNIFEIECAGELMEILQNIGIFIDTDGFIREQPNYMQLCSLPVNSLAPAPLSSTYSFIQEAPQHISTGRSGGYQYPKPSLLGHPPPYHTLSHWSGNNNSQPYNNYPQSVGSQYCYQLRSHNGPTTATYVDSCSSGHNIEPSGIGFSVGQFHRHNSIGRREKFEEDVCGRVTRRRKTQI